MHCRAAGWAANPKPLALAGCSYTHQALVLLGRHMIARSIAATRGITSGRFALPLPFCSQALLKQYLGRHLKTSSAGHSPDRGTMAGTDPTEIQKGDTVEWKWGGAKHITGEVRGVGLLEGGHWIVPQDCVLLQAFVGIEFLAALPANLQHQTYCFLENVTKPTHVQLNRTLPVDPFRTAQPARRWWTSRRRARR